MKKILDHVELENNRLWRLYDNQLEGTNKIRSSQYKSATGKNSARPAKKKSETNLKHCESEKKVAEFMQAVKNHTIYRRDNFVRNLSSQVKKHFDPYLKFQIKEPTDPFQQRPLSSIIKRTAVMYPSRDAIARANKTDDITRPPDFNTNFVRSQLRPGQSRPFSSHLNQILILKDHMSQTGLGLSIDKFTKNDVNHNILSTKLISKTTNVDGISSSQQDQLFQQHKRTLPHEQGAVQHQRLLSYQINQRRQKESDDNAKTVTKPRPGSSAPMTAKMLQYMSMNLKRKDTEIQTTRVGMSETQGREDFINVRQMLDPSFDQSNRMSSTAKQTKKFVSETDMQSGILSGQIIANDTAFEEKIQPSDHKRAVTRTKSSPYSTAKMSQPTSTPIGGNKSSQNLISQLRIKSVRQSKVRIISDPSFEGHFDVMVDYDRAAKGWIPTRHTTSRIQTQDKIISNATNLNRGSEVQTPFISTQTSIERFKKTSSHADQLLYHKNDFPDTNCNQLDIEVLQKYGVIEHMSDFLVYSETRSPIFLYTPSGNSTKANSTLIRFKQSLFAGELDQAMTTLDQGMKEQQDLDVFKLNAGVAYLLKHQYLEAVQTFRFLSKKYPWSPTVTSNLLFAYLCDGWLNNVKEFQSTSLFKSIKAPLSPQTKSILELIKYAFSSPDSIIFSQRQNGGLKGKAKFSSTLVSSKELNKGLNGEDFASDLRSNEQSQVLEADESNIEQDDVKQTKNEDAIIEFLNFKKYRKIKDFTQRQKFEPIHHVLRQKLRQDRKGFSRPKSFSPTSRGDSCEGRNQKKNYWQLYQGMLREYHRKDNNRHKVENAYFEKMLDKLHKLCNDEEQFQTGIITKIVKTSEFTDHIESQKSHSRIRKMSTSKPQIFEHQANGEVQQQKRGGDVNKILREVKKVEEEQMRKDLDTMDDEGLDNIFKQLVSLRATYISDAYSDPIESSYMQLIDGLGVFHERYNVRTFIDSYMEMLSDIKKAEEVTKLIEAAGGKWKVDPDLLAKKLSNKELEIRFLNSFPCFDEQVDRARTFIYSILQRREEKDILQLKKTFEDMAYFAEDRRRSLQMDPERLEIEESFIQIIREFIQVQQELAYRLKITKSAQIVSEMKEKSALNEAYLQLCYDLKDLSGRHDDTVLIKTLDITKSDYAARAELELQVQSPLNEKNLGVGILPQEKINEYQELYTKGWENKAYRLLSKEERLQIAQQISMEAEDLLNKARLRIQQENEDKNRHVLDKKALSQMKRQQEQKAFEARRDLEKQKLKREAVRTLLHQQMSNMIHEKIKIAQSSILDFEYDLINKKLNLDAIEIQSILPKSSTQDVGIWEETAALKAITQKIASINETIMNPNLLLEKDKIKHKPLLEAWNQQSSYKHCKTNKAFRHLSTAMKNQLKEDTIPVDEKRKHWKVRPKIGHEVTDNHVKLIENSLLRFAQLSETEREALDLLLAKNNRFFSIFDQTTRLNMYAHCVVNRYTGKDLQIERDVEETEFIHIMLRGNIHIVQVNDELDIKLRLASLRAGETCGDQAIQRKIRDPLKILSTERKCAVTNTEETITITINREKFMEALFKEMQEELFYKIILLRNTAYFQELSPYSLTIIASNLEVREVKYGEVIVQQGHSPDALYILAFGQCKTVYQYMEQKSTKVSKFANKCLKSDLPTPIHTGMINYKTLPQIQYENAVKTETNVETDHQAAQKKANKLERTGTDPGSLNRVLSNTIKNFHNDGIESKLAKLPAFPKRSFYHTVLREDKKTMTIQFQNHLLYGKLKVGSAFGMRALLDPLICKKHIIENKELFCQKLDINLTKLWDELIDKNRLELESNALRKVQRKEANKQATKFCKKCFEKRATHCECRLEKLSEGQRKIADKERAKAALNEESSFCEEFNDSHDFDISLKQEEQTENPLASNPEQVNKVKRAKRQDMESVNLSLDKAYVEQRDKVRMQIEELTKVEDTEEKQTKNQQKKNIHRERLQKKVEEQFSGRLYQQLMLAQASVIVTSSTAKFLVIKKEDKGLLNEYLRVCIDRAILETNFVDLDRPENNHQDVQSAVQMSRGWNSFKEQFMTDIMKETKMAKKTNKLLDD